MGRDYTLRVSEADEAMTREIAGYVDAKMSAFRSAFPKQPEITTAVIAALAIAEELYTSRERQDRIIEDTDNEVNALAEKLSGVRNLHADARVGIIDRHNYFAARPHRMEPGPFPNHAMVAHAGSGLFSSGLQAVRGRPFVFSEWISKMPNEWIAEGPAIIGVYGMGLQGWDGSYHFASRGAGYTEALEGGGVYNTNHPTQIGLFPALARMIYRGDITEGAPLPNRKVHVPDLEDGTLGFHEKVRQQGDIKSLGGDVPIDALAVGRLMVEFTDRSAPTVLPDFSTLQRERIARSNTGELVWDYREEGYFTVNTAGTRAVVL